MTLAGNAARVKKQWNTAFAQCKRPHDAFRDHVIHKNCEYQTEAFAGRGGRLWAATRDRESGSDKLAEEMLQLTSLEARISGPPPQHTNTVLHVTTGRHNPQAAWLSGDGMSNSGTPQVLSRVAEPSGPFAKCSNVSVYVSAVMSDCPRKALELQAAHIETWPLTAALPTIHVASSTASEKAVNMQNAKRAASNSCVKSCVLSQYFLEVAPSNVNGPFGLCLYHVP